MHQLSARLSRSVGLGPCPVASLRAPDELFRIALEGSEEEMRKLLQYPQVNVNRTLHLSLVALHRSAEFNLFLLKEWNLLEIFCLIIEKVNINMFWDGF